MEQLYSEDPFERACAAFLLGQQGEKATTAVPFLAALLADGAQSRERKTCGGYVFNSQGFVVSPGRSAAEALAEMGPSAVRVLIRALDNDNSTIQFNAELGVAKLQDAQVLRSLLKHDRSIVRAYALSAIKNVAATSRALAPRNATPEYNGKFNIYGFPPSTYLDPELVVAIIASLRDADERVRQGSLAALREATDQDLGLDSAAWEKWWEHKAKK